MRCTAIYVKGGILEGVYEMLKCKSNFEGE